MTPTDEIAIAEIRELIARQKIADVQARYARGIDRCELDTLLSVFWPEATADYGAGPQVATVWARATVAALKGMLRTQHAVSNLLVEFHSDHARAETYCQAYHELDGADGRREMIVGGRYLDRLEQRGGEWRIAQRTYVMDWNRNVASTSQWEEGIYSGLKIRGARWPGDPLRTFVEAN